MILEIIVFAIFLATVFNIILNKFNMPTIIGYILTGTLISYVFGLHEVSGNTELKTIGEFGIVFLMFTIGLEFSFKQLVKMKKNVFLYGSLQFFFTSFVFYGISNVIFGFDIKESIIIAVGLALSSTAVVLKILNENGDINKHYGNRAFGILLFQDIMVIPILLLITIFSSTNDSIGTLLSHTIISAFVLLFTLWFFGKFLLDWFLYKVAKTKSNEIFIGSILFLVIGASALSHFLGFSYSLGALIAGILIAETHYKHQVEADLIPFRDLLLGFFFVTVGMQLKLGIIYDNLLLLGILLTSLLLIKVFLLYFILMWTNHKKSALKTAISLFQFGEFGIVVFEIAGVNNLLDHSVGQLLIVVIILSMIITPLILKHISIISDFLLNVKNSNSDDDGCLLNKKLNNHVVLIGYGRLGQILGKLLEKHKIDYIIIENDIKIFKESKREGKPIIFGNAFQANTLKSVNIEDAQTVLISIGKSEKLFLVSNVVKKLNIKGNIIVKVNNFNEEEMLKDLNIENIIVETEKTALAMFEKVKY